MKNICAKRLLAGLLVLVMLSIPLGYIKANAYAISDRAKTIQSTTLKIASRNITKKTYQNNRITDIMELNDNADIEISYNDEETYVESIDGKFSNQLVDSVETALNSIYSVRVLLGITNPQEELECKAENHNDVSVSYSFSQKYRGIPVYGTSITVSADSDTGEVQALNSSYIPNHKLESMNLTPEISLDEIKSKFGDIKTCELNIYAIKDHTENPILVYVMTTTDEVIIADANNGNEVLRFQSTTDWKSASTTGFGQTEKGENVTFPIQFKWFGFYPYYQKDIERQIEIKGDKSGSLAHDFNTIWLDKTANSAYTNIIKVYDWYKIYKYQVESGMFSHIKMVF